MHEAWESDQELANDSDTSLDEEEEGSWEGLDGIDDGKAVEIPNDRHGTTPKKPPTGEELRTIKDAADLYMSSSFKLQVSLIIYTHDALIMTIFLLARLTHCCQKLDPNIADLPLLKSSSIRCIRYSPLFPMYLRNILSTRHANFFNAGLLFHILCLSHRRTPSGKSHSPSHKTSI